MIRNVWDGRTLNTKQILLAARTLIAKRERWTQGAAAISGNGDRVAPRNPTACRWCADGAISYVSFGSCDEVDARKTLARAAAEIAPISATTPYPHIALNDGISVECSMEPFEAHRNILLAFDRAIRIIDGASTR